LDGKTILQVDATVIIGVFFFLSLTSFLQVGSQEGIAKVIIVTMTSIIVLPFSLSAISVVRAGRAVQRDIMYHFLFVKHPRTLRGDIHYIMAKASKRAFLYTAAGFGYLLLVLILFGVSTAIAVFISQDVSQK
jgi:hypothetical protein